MYRILFIIIISTIFNILRIQASESLPDFVNEGIERVKVFSLHNSLRGFDFEDPNILESYTPLQALQEVLEPLSDWLSENPKNLSLFFNLSGLNDVFNKKELGEESQRVIFSAIHRQVVPAEDSVYETAITQASSKYKIKEHNDSFDNALYVWLVEYIRCIQDMNQIKGGAVWKVRYAGKINGILYQENQEVTIEDVADLSEQYAIQKNARAIRDEVEFFYKRVPESTYNYYYTIFKYAYNFVDQFYVEFICESIGYNGRVRILKHPLLDQINYNIPRYPGFSLEDTLAGAHQVSEPTGAVHSALYQMDNTAGIQRINNQARALEYLINRRIIPSNLKLVVSLAISNCF